MRDLRFRAYNIKSKEMLNNVSIYSHGDSPAYINTEWFVNPKMDNCIVMQYIGIKDNNGKDIYDGDIVEFQEKSLYEKKYIGKIYWSETDFFDNASPIFIRSSIGNGSLSWYKNIIVIGNIYENPELLNESK